MQYLLYTPPSIGNPITTHLPDLVQANDAPVRKTEPLEIAGPDGLTGGLIWYFDDSATDPHRLSQLPTLDYRPAEQDWKQIGGTPVWIGTQHDKPVTPADLIRAGGQADGHRFAGNHALLLDQNLWLVPNQTRLPCLLALNEAGDIVTAPEKAHRLTYDRMQWAFDQCSALLQGQWEGPDAKPAATDRDLLEYVGLVLGLNYRLTWRIILTLELVKAETVWVIVRASTDAAAINRLLDELQKKTEATTPAGSVSAAGDPDS